jgi:Zn-dependent peptidase ImmA (M78 family)
VGKLRRNLRRFGLSDSAVNAAWPGWWGDEAEGSPSAQVELRFSLARKLGLDPRSLLEDDAPRFVWRDEGKFKRLSSESDTERAAITSFGISIARGLVAATAEGPLIEGVEAQELRNSILARQDYVRLVDLLGVCWAMGIAVIHLRVFPLTAKRMCAMSVRVGNRFAILLGQDSEYPAPICYFIAHEIGHAALGHIKNESALIDLVDPLESIDSDHEEQAADRYALELLTGTPTPTVTTETRRFTAKQLARNLLQTAKEVRIEPGTLALCFGHSTGDWKKAYAAMKEIYSTRQPVWEQVNKIALDQLDWVAIPDDLAHFVRAVMGGMKRHEGSR